MIRLSKLTATTAALAFGLAFSAPASAQATRTWVSGVGDDVNPCSRTAPCKTFAGAISKTAAGGEINCLDPGGFGAVTITKSMTISCQYTEGGALAGGNGITVNAQPTDTVFLRGLDIFGVNPPSNGVRFIAGGALIIEDCTIRRFNAANSFGVSFQPSADSTLVIANSTISDNGNGATGGGILVKPTGTGTGKVTLRNVRLTSNSNQAVLIDTTGVTNAGGTNVTVDDSLVARNAAGIKVLAPGGSSPVNAMLVDSVISNNFFAGVSADGSAATLRVGNTTIHGNGTGVSALNTAQVRSYGDNRNDGNNNDGAFSVGILPKE